LTEDRNIIDLFVDHWHPVKKEETRLTNNKEYKKRNEFEDSLDEFIRVRLRNSSKKTTREKKKKEYIAVYSTDIHFEVEEGEAPEEVLESLDFDFNDIDHILMGIFKKGDEAKLHFKTEIKEKKRGG